MRTTVETHVDRVIVRIAGRVAGVAALELFNTLGRFREGSVSAVVVDLTDVSGLDSIAMATVVHTGESLRKTGKRLVVACPDHAARHLLGDLCTVEAFELVDHYTSSLDAA
jgi:anti-anti-sigma factor